MRPLRTSAPVGNGFHSLVRGRSVRLLTLGVTLTALVGLSGCTAPDDAPPENPLFGYCPQWDQGPGAQKTGLLLTSNDTIQFRDLEVPQEMWDNHVLDMFRVRIDTLNLTGRLELRAFSASPENKQLGMRDYRNARGPEIVPVAILGASDVGHEFDVLRSAVTHGATPAMLPLRLQWTVAGEEAEAFLEYTVTFHYKVCGAET